MRGLLIAFTFYTRIPLPIPKDITSEEFTHSQVFYPWVGLTIGLILWLIAKTIHPYYPPLILAALILVAELVLTGGLHLDGYMDSMDGLLSARTPDRVLEIMKDSRVGAHASMAIFGLLILKFTLLASIASSQYNILIIMPMLSRWVFQIGVILFPYARKEGLGKGLHEASHKIFFVFTGCLVCLISYFLIGIGGPIAFIVTSLAIFFLASKISAFLGGLTGDLYGAFIEISEVICLFAAFPFLR